MPKGGNSSSGGGGGSGSDIGCRVFNSAQIAIPNAALTALTFDSERWDTDTMHSTSSNTNRITFTTAGKYIVGGNVEWLANTIGIRDVVIRLNGATRILWQSLGAGAAPFNTPIQSVATMYNFAAADYIELMVVQTSGGSLNTETNANWSPEFWAQKVLG